MAKSPDNEVSLFDELRSGGYESSLITTFNTYLPFYEEVVLRKLVSSGCRHNVLLVDHGQCAQALRDTNYRPGAAGSQYTLVPIKVPGAFHPKITFLAGPKKILILVGSHNVTVSGFGYNRELTNRIEVIKGGDAESYHLAAAVWRALSDWLHDQEELLPEELIKAAISVREAASWLKVDSKPVDSPFIASAPKRPSLWDQMKPYISARPKRVAVLGPFFDEDFSFIRQIAQDVKPTKISIGIEPETVSLGRSSRLDAVAQLVDASFLYKQRGYLHAKAVLVELRSGDQILATGSANPGFTAWLRPELTGNAEAIIVHSGKRATSLAKHLGIDRLFKAKPISRTQLKEIESRSAQLRKGDPPTIDPLAVAVETNDGFRICAKSVSTRIREARLLDDSLNTLMTVKKFPQSAGYIILPVSDQGIREKTHEIVLTAGIGRDTLLLVHHTELIWSRSQSSRQVQFRTALASLSSDYPDLANLIATVEKIIFDDKAEIARPQRHKEVKTSKRSIADARPESLGVDLDTLPARSHAHRLIRSGDLGYLLDALIHRLGIGLTSQNEQLDRQGRTEEEQRDQDDDDIPDHTPTTVSDRDLAAICRRKIKTLVSRMLRQLEQATENDSDPTLTLVQLVAVLATLREIRTLENHPRWSSLHEVLVPSKEKEAMLYGAVAYLYAPKTRLIDRVLTELDSDQLPDEVSRLPGMLFWLAWECGIKLEDGRLFGENPEERDNRNFVKAILLTIAPPTSHNRLAFEEAQESIRRTAKPIRLPAATQWLKKHIDWGRSVNPHNKPLSALPKKVGTPEPGDIAYATYATNPTLFVVSSNDGKFVGLFDFMDDDSEIRYLADKVSAIQL